MLEVKKYNNLSPQLRKKIPSLKRGEKVTFQLDGVRPDRITGKMICPNSYAILPYDRIFDPWAGEKADKGQGADLGGGKDSGFMGEYIDIAYIDRESPAPRDSTRDTIITFGKIRFLRTQAGIIEVIGGQKNTEKILMMLFLSNNNSTNIDKPWYVKPVGRPVFHQIEATKTAKNTLTIEIKKDKAKSIIMDMSAEEIEANSAGLFANTYRSMSKEQRLLHLRKIAEQSPDKILDLSKDVSVKTTAFIEQCLKEGIIEMDGNKREFIWPDDKTMICTVKPGQTPHNSLKRYFMTEEGVQVLESLEKQLAGAKKKKTEKTEKALV